MWRVRARVFLALAVTGCAAEVRARAVPPDVVVGILDRGTMIGRGLGQGDAPWRYEHELESRPVIAGSLVVGLGGGEVFALDARSGEEVWRRRAVGRLRGAADDGATTLVSIASLGGARSTVLAIERGGVVMRQIELDEEVGAPAIRDAYAFLPIDAHALAVVDLVDGSERARIDTGPTSRATMVDGALWTGEGLRALRIDDALAEAPVGARVAIAIDGWPGQASWIEPGDGALPPWATRADAVRVLARPAMPLAGAALVAHRLVVGLAPDGAILWARAFPSTVLGGAAGVSAVTVCDAGGRLRWLDLATGGLRRELDLGQALVGCVVQADRSPPSPGAAPPLATQLGRALRARGRELVPYQLVLLDRLAAIDDDLATRWLASLARADAGVEPAVAARAAEHLAARRATVAGAADPR
jgi:outer membrane protein assembly factor BamB